MLTNMIKWNCPACVSKLQVVEENQQNLGPAPPQRQAPEEPMRADILQAIFHQHSDNLNIAHINIRSLLSSKTMVEHH